MVASNFWSSCLYTSWVLELQACITIASVDDVGIKLRASCGQARQALNALSHFPGHDWAFDGLFYKDKKTREGKDKGKHGGGAVGLYDSGSEVPRRGLLLTGIFLRALSQELGETDLHSW